MRQNIISEVLGKVRYELVMVKVKIRVRLHDEWKSMQYSNKDSSTKRVCVFVMRVFPLCQLTLDNPQTFLRTANIQSTV